MKALTYDQRSLRVFLETRAVDHAGRVNLIHMNDQDLAQACAWHDVGLISFGRICAGDITDDGSHWVEFGEEAFTLAHAERRARAARAYAIRSYQSTADSRRERTPSARPTPPE